MLIDENILKPRRKYMIIVKAIRINQIENLKLNQTGHVWFTEIVIHIKMGITIYEKKKNKYSY